MAVQEHMVVQEQDFNSGTVCHVLSHTGRIKIDQQQWEL